MRIPFPLFLAMTIQVISLTPVGAQDDKPINVEPGDLTKRPDLINREIAVDDRVGRYQFHPEKGIDQIYLRRAPDVPFELPERLRPLRSPGQPGVLVRGVLRKEGDRFYVDVSSFDSLPSDIDRLNRAIALVPKADSKNRAAWAGWGARRAKAFGDDALRDKAREIDHEAIVVDAERPGGPDAKSHWLALAKRAIDHEIPEPEPSALIHRALRLALASAKTNAEFRSVITSIESFLPESSSPVAEPPDGARWDKAYSLDPWNGYRSAPSAVRVALNHRLWADAVEQMLRARATPTTPAAELVALADEATTRLSDRPKVAEAFLERAAEVGSKDVASLRQREVDALASLYRDRLHQPEKALALYRAWLEDQRINRLSPRDADGRVALSHQYEALLGDKTNAIALLKDAFGIDPTSKDAVEAFVRLGYRKVGDQWIERTTTTDSDSPNPGAPRKREEVDPAQSPSDGLRNSTPEEVRARLGGKPDRITRSATQENLTEQWIYFGKAQNQYINFARKSGESRSRVVSYYSLPRGLSDTSTSP